MTAKLLIINSDGEMSLEDPRPGMNPANLETIYSGPAEKIQEAKAVFLIQDYKNDSVDVIQLKCRGRVNFPQVGIDVF